MTDEYTHVLPQHALRITAAYPASDGRVPESIEIEVGFELVDHVAADPAFIDRAVRSLARVADQRHRDVTITGSGFDPATLRRVIDRERELAARAGNGATYARGGLITDETTTGGGGALDLDTIGRPAAGDGEAAQ